MKGEITLAVLADRLKVMAQEPKRQKGKAQDITKGKAQSQSAQRKKSEGLHPGYGRRQLDPALWARVTKVATSQKPKRQKSKIKIEKNKTDKKTLPNSSCTGTNWRAGRCPPRGRSIARVRAVSFAARTGSDRDTF